LIWQLLIILYKVPIGFQGKVVFGLD